MKEMQISTLKHDINALEDVYSREQCLKIATAFKSKAFGVISGIKRIFTKEDSIALNHSEKRYEPFWNVAGKSIFEYKRKTEYSFYTKPEVKQVKINNKSYKVDGGKCSFVGEDHCFEEHVREFFVDASSGIEKKELARYLDFKSRKIAETEELMKGDTVVMPVKIKVSSIIRNLIKELIKPIEADKILDERLELTKVSLYFRPIWAFEFIDKRNNNIGVLDVDALTGEVKKGNIYKRSFKEIFSEKDLFEIGAEFVADIIPGTRSAMMIAKKIKEARKNKHK